MHSSLSSHRAPGLELDLPRFRKRAGVSLEQIAQSTKISSRFLQAIEGEQFEQLPGGIFSTSYLRQYAEAIGYDEDALVAYYNQKMNPLGGYQSHDRRRPAFPMVEPRRKRR